MLHWSRLIDQCHAGEPYQGSTDWLSQNLNLNFKKPVQVLAFAVSSNTRHDVITLNIVIIRSYSNWRIDCWVVHRSYGLKFVNNQGSSDTKRTPWQIKGLTWSPQIKEWAKSIPRKLLFRHDSFIVILIWCVLDSLCGVHVNSKRSTLLPSSSWQCGIWRPSENNINSCAFCGHFRRESWH